MQAACPHCGSRNVLFLKKQHRYICGDCEHQFEAATECTASLRIFLSYGHDSNAKLVTKIKIDLENRGHDVWFDKSEMKSGDDWRRSITDGITDSHRVLSFLSKYSTRDPGVCLDEIAIAVGVKGGNIHTILVESEQQVQPPASIGHIQWLDMHDWKERQAAADEGWETWYTAKFREIITVVESDESRRFAGEIEQLAGILQPISSDSRIHQLLTKGLVGRGWLIDAIEEWRRADDDSRLFWIVGAPGVGKSAFVAHLAHYGRDKVIAVQFSQYDKPDHRSAHRIVRTLAFQIATRLPDYRKLLLTLPEIQSDQLDQRNAAELFDYLLADPLRNAIDGGRERYLMVIDALDEAGANGRNELVEMLAQNAPRLPAWIGIVITSRPESHVLAPLQGLRPHVLDTATESNRADLRQYLQRELASDLENCPDADNLIEQILERSEGVFLYAERFCGDVRQGHLSLDRPEQFPRGLGDIFLQYFQRQFPGVEPFRRDIRPALRVILAAREPLPLDLLQHVMNWGDETLRDVIRPLGSLFPVARDGGCEVIKPYHKSLVDWLRDGEQAGCYYVSAVEGHRMLADYCWTEFRRKDSKASRYSLLYLPAHLQESGQWERLADILCSEELLDARSSLDPSGIVMVNDYNNALQVLPEKVWERIWESPRECVLFALAGIRHFADQGLLDECLNMLQRCAGLVMGRDVPEVHCAWHTLAGRLAATRGDDEKAERMLLEGLQLARQAEFYEGLVGFIPELHVLLRASGRMFGRAEELLLETLAIQSSASQLEFEVRTHQALVMLLIRMGHPLHAAEHLESAREILANLAVPDLEAMMKKCKGYLSLYEGRFRLAAQQFACASTKFQEIADAEESQRCRELVDFARLTAAEMTSVGCLRAWREKLLTFSPEAGQLASSQVTFCASIQFLDELAGRASPDVNANALDGRDAVAVGSAVEELARTNPAFTGPNEPDIQRETNVEQARRACQQAARYITSGKLNEASRIIAQLPDTPAELAQWKLKLQKHIEEVLKTKGDGQAERMFDRVEQLFHTGEFHAAREAIESLPDRPDGIVALKQQWLGRIEASIVLAPASQLLSAGHFRAAREVITHLPDHPHHLRQLKRELLWKIDSAERSDGFATFERSKRLAEAGDFCKAKEILEGLSDSTGPLVRLKSNWLREIDELSRDLALERSKQLVEEHNFRAAKETIERLPEAPDLAGVKRDWRVQIEAAEARNRVDQALEQASRLVGAGKFAEARRIVQRLPDATDDLTRVKQESLVQIDVAEAVKHAIEQVSRLVGAGKFAEARRIVVGLPDTPHDLQRLKADFLQQIADIERSI